MVFYICLLVQTEKYYIRVHNIVVTVDNKFNNNLI